MSNIKTIRIQMSSANDGAYGPDTTNEEAAQVASNLCDLAAAYAAHYWPDAEVEADVTSWPDVRGNNYAVTDDGDFIREEDTCDDNPALSIDNFISQVWTDEPLWSADFDADAYLAQHFAAKEARRVAVA